MTTLPPRDVARRVPAWRAWTNPVDLAIAGVLMLWSVLEALLVPSASITSQLAFALAVSLPLVVRRRFPITVVTVIGAALVVHASLAGADATFNPFPSLLVATFTVAERVAAWWLAALAGFVPIAAMLGANAFGYFGAEGIDAAGTLLLIFFIGATWGAGRIVRHRVLLAQDARNRSDQQAMDAVAAERERISRELHDIVAHALSIIALQSAAAERFVEKDPARAREHLAFTRRTAQQALGEMRHLLGVLREEPVLYSPQPGISQIRGLADEAEASGSTTRLDIDPAVEDLPDGAALAVYRVIQESLTNVRKHAPGAEVYISVRRDGAEVLATVENGPSSSALAETVPGSGRGLPGMAERARVYGGTLDAGATAGSGWRVHLSVPIGVEA